LPNLDPELEATVTDDRMAVLELVEKAATADLAREMLAFASKRPVIHAAFSVDACASPVGRHRHGSSSSIRLMG
jgi:hypothetical protein